MDDSTLAMDGGAPRHSGAGAPATPSPATAQVRQRTVTKPAAPTQRAKVSGTLLVTGHRLRWWRELLMTLLLYVFYESTRNLSKSGAGLAFFHAEQIMDWQQALGINVEHAVQQIFLPHRWVIILSNYFYGTGYVLTTIGALLWLYRRRPDYYPFWRNTLVVGTLVGLIGFRFYPLMPPRLLDVHLGQSVFGFVDTLRQFPTLWSFDNSAMEKVSNQYAAMPSLHCGWAMWVAASTVGLVRTSVMKVAVVLLPLVTIFVVVVTANHYLLDAVGGLVIMMIGFGVAQLITRAGIVPLRDYRMKDGTAVMPMTE